MNFRVNIQDNIDAGNFEYVDEIYCPYCGFIQEDLFEVVGAYEEGEHELTCQHCNKDFELVTQISYTYSTYVTKKEENDEE